MRTNQVEKSFLGFFSRVDYVFEISVTNFLSGVVNFENSFLFKFQDSILMLHVGFVGGFVVQRFKI